MTAQPLHLYRKLLRTVTQTFKQDLNTIRAARTEIRQRFQESSKETNPAALQELIAQGEEANAFIKECVVQGQLNSQGDFETDASKAALIQEDQKSSRSPDQKL